MQSPTNNSNEISSSTGAFKVFPNPVLFFKYRHLVIIILAGQHKMMTTTTHDGGSHTPVVISDENSIKTITVGTEQAHLIGKESTSTSMRMDTTNMNTCEPVGDKLFTILKQEGIERIYYKMKEKNMQLNWDDLESAEQDDLKDFCKNQLELDPLERMKFKKVVKNVIQQQSRYKRLSTASGAPSHSHSHSHSQSHSHSHKGKPCSRLTQSTLNAFDQTLTSINNNVSINNTHLKPIVDMNYFSPLHSCQRHNYHYNYNHQQMYSNINTVNTTCTPTKQTQHETELEPVQMSTTAMVGHGAMMNPKLPLMFRVIVIGDAGVGKTSLIREYHHLAQAHVDVEGIEFKQKNNPKAENMTTFGNINDTSDRIGFGQNWNANVTDGGGGELRKGRTRLVKHELNDFMECIIETDNKKYDAYLHICDTADIEKYGPQNIPSKHYTLVDCIIIMYDVCNLQSFQNIDKIWLKEIERHCDNYNYNYNNNNNNGPMILLIGNTKSLNPKIANMNNNPKDSYVSTMMAKNKYRFNKRITKNISIKEVNTLTNSNIEALFEQIGQELVSKRVRLLDQTYNRMYNKSPNRSNGGGHGKYNGYNKNNGVNIERVVSFESQLHYTPDTPVTVSISSSGVITATPPLINYPNYHDTKGASIDVQRTFHSINSEFQDRQTYRNNNSGCCSNS